MVLFLLCGGAYIACVMKLPIILRSVLLHLAGGVGVGGQREAMGAHGRVHRPAHRDRSRCYRAHPQATSLGRHPQVLFIVQREKVINVTTPPCKTAGWRCL